ncbi:MAG: TIGR01906 family membrane protein [Erysipelotrichaceae bacterium]|nr:TIGR01906 family membrane protein [Erysipelotrichaceae bacterium]
MSRALNNIISFCFIVVIFITAIDIISFDRNFYRKEYEELNVAETIGITSDDLMIVTDKLLNYTQGKDSDLVIIKPINGQEREVFNDKEKEHMIDVAKLYQNAILVRNSALAIVVFGLLIISIKLKTAVFAKLFTSYNKTSMFVLFLITIIMLIALVDFNWFWTNFHYIFFAGNDLWILNPRTDILIMMVPEQFFYDLVMRIATTFILTFLLTNIVAYFNAKRIEKRAS